MRIPEVLRHMSSKGKRHRRRKVEWKVKIVTGYYPITYSDNDDYKIRAAVREFTHTLDRLGFLCQI